MTVREIIMVVLFAALGVAAVTDSRRMEIPIPLFPACCLISGALLMYADDPRYELSNALMGLAVLAVPFILGAFFHMCGGGDILMFAGTGFMLGLWRIPLYAICLAAAAVLMFLWILLKRLLEKRGVKRASAEWVPLAPPAFWAYVFYLLLMWLIL